MQTTMLYHAIGVFFCIMICSVIRTDGVILNCTEGFHGTPNANTQSIALGKPTDQSSTYYGYNSSLAVDGRTNTLFEDGTCTHTADDDASYWTVLIDAEIKYNFTNITLYLRNAGPERYSNMRVLIDGTLILYIKVANVSNMPYPNPVHMSGCDHQLRGNNITILVDNGNLTLCEVQLWACNDTYFGRHCENSCKCLDQSEVCDKTTGYCSSGCDRGWHGDGCQIECDDGYFGDCIEECNCQNSTEICEKPTGVCPNSGCKHGTYEPDCQTACRNKTFGYNCSRHCGNCKNSPCDSETGVCKTGCEAGWRSERCDKVCLDGTHGEDCSSSCGLCLNNVTCDRENGECPNGCQDGNVPPLCKEMNIVEVVDSTPYEAIAGAVAAAVLLVAVVTGLLFFWKRRKATKKNTSVRNVTEYVNNVELVDENLENVSGTDPPQAVQSNDTSPYEAFDHFYNNIPAYISLDSLKQYVRSKTVEDGFEAEFKMIRYGLNGGHEAGKIPENKKRNRFLNLYPYDHSRVRLLPDGESTWDYINANFVLGYSDKTTYIAAQGPNPVTVDDFWRMIWQQNVRKIVMLTRLFEMRKKKCEQYWPECDEKKQCGNITIESTLSVGRSDFTIRKFNIKHNMGGERRTITQFHFTTWPDHDVPTAPALVGFWKQVKLVDTDEQEGPPVVHCSAGVGRTGTFIALDSLVTQAEIENRVNVFLCVTKMRESRMNMVQTAHQYKFVYEALLEALESRGTLYTNTDFDKKYGTDETYSTAQEEEVRRQFQRLQTLKVELHKIQVSDSLLPENVNKNRSMDILPGNPSRPFLTTSVTGCNDYINAVVLPSATRSQYFIVTQTPLPETVVDFWRLVYDHDCHTIVCLDDSQDALCMYPREKTSSTVGPFTVETVAVDTTWDSYVQVKMTLSHEDKNENKRELLVYRTVCLDTTSGQHDMATILEFLNFLVTSNTDREEKMLVQCFDGSRVCGVFCSLMNIVSRLRLDKEVDIFLAIRELQTVRPQFVKTFDQYKLCHDMVKEYSRSSNVYANV